MSNIIEFSKLVARKIVINLNKDGTTITSSQEYDIIDIIYYQTQRFIQEEYNAKSK